MEITNITWTGRCMPIRPPKRKRQHPSRSPWLPITLEIIFPTCHRLKFQTAAATTYITFRTDERRNRQAS